MTSVDKQKPRINTVPLELEDLCDPDIPAKLRVLLYYKTQRWVHNRISADQVADLLGLSLKTFNNARGLLLKEGKLKAQQLPSLGSGDKGKAKAWSAPQRPISLTERQIKVAAKSYPGCKFTSGEEKPEQKKKSAGNKQRDLFAIITAKFPKEGLDKDFLPIAKNTPLADLVSGSEVMWACCGAADTPYEAAWLFDNTVNHWADFPPKSAPRQPKLWLKRVAQNRIGSVRAAIRAEKQQAAATAAFNRAAQAQE